MTGGLAAFIFTYTRLLEVFVKSGDIYRKLRMIKVNERNICGLSAKKMTYIYIYSYARWADYNDLMGFADFVSANLGR